jgi:hypothetical protein
MLVVFLDELAKEWHLTKVSSETPSRKTALHKVSTPDPKSPFAQTSVGKVP